MTALCKIVLLVTCYLLLVTPVHAQTSTPSAIPYTLYPIPSAVAPTSPIYTDLLVHNMFHSFSCLSIGSSIIGQPCLTYQITKDAQGTIQGIPYLSQANLSGGVLGATTSLISLLYLNPPVRTADYLASLGEGLGIVKPAHAQVVGSGAQVLSPIIKLWQVSRNITYVIMIIIFVIIGFMVMFRQRINPQTVITAQAALPGLVIGLILITFSYFFAALLSDTAFLGTNLVGYYFTSAQGKGSTDLVEKTEEANVLSIFSVFTTMASKDEITNVLGSIWNNFTDDTARFLVAISTLLTAQLTAQSSEVVKAIPTYGLAIQALILFGVGVFTAQNPVAIVGAFLFVIATAILLYSMFKLLLRLINNFLSIIFLTITAPFHFLAASLPGRQGIVTGWILNMLCNILAFPAVLAVFYFVAYLLGPDKIDLNKLPFQISEATSIVGNQAFPLFGGLDLSFINFLLAFGALVASPSIPDIICRVIGRVGVAGQLIGQELGGSVGAGRGYAGQFQGGVGAAAGYVAGARGLFPTPTYIADTRNGKIVGFSPSRWQYTPGGLGKFGEFFERRFGKKELGPTWIRRK